MANIWRSKGNQTVKVGHIIEYNMKTILNKKSFLKCDRETIPDLFLKYQNWAYLWINSLKFYTVCCYCMPSPGLSNYIKSKLQTTCFTSYKAFLKYKKRHGSSLLLHFLSDLLRKIFLSLYSINRPNFLVWLPFLLQILGNMSIAIVCWPSHEIWN